jgi:hypothetical protein
MLPSLAACEYPMKLASASCVLPWNGNLFFRCCQLARKDPSGRTFLCAKPEGPKMHQLPYGEFPCYYRSDWAHGRIFVRGKSMFSTSHMEKDCRYCLNPCIIEMMDDGPNCFHHFIRSPPKCTHTHTQTHTRTHTHTHTHTHSYTNTQTNGHVEVDVLVGDADLDIWRVYASLQTHHSPPPFPSPHTHEQYTHSNAQVIRQLEAPGEAQKEKTRECTREGLSFEEVDYYN